MAVSNTAGKTDNKQNSKRSTLANKSKANFSSGVRAPAAFPMTGCHDTHQATPESEERTLLSDALPTAHADRLILARRRPSVALPLAWVFGVHASHKS